jgi:hypothetical protein
MSISILLPGRIYAFSKLCSPNRRKHALTSTQRCTLQFAIEAKTALLRFGLGICSHLHGLARNRRACDRRRYGGDLQLAQAAAAVKVRFQTPYSLWLRFIGRVRTDKILRRLPSAQRQAARSGRQNEMRTALAQFFDLLYSLEVSSHVQS